MMTPLPNGTEIALNNIGAARQNFEDIRTEVEQDTRLSKDYKDEVIKKARADADGKVDMALASILGAWNPETLEWDGGTFAGEVAAAEAELLEAQVDAELTDPILTGDGATQAAYYVSTLPALIAGFDRLGQAEASYDADRNPYRRRAWQDAGYPLLYQKFRGTADAQRLGSFKARLERDRATATQTPRLAAARARIEQVEAKWQQVANTVQSHSVRGSGFFQPNSSYWGRVQMLRPGGGGKEAAGGVYWPKKDLSFSEG